VLILEPWDAIYDTDDERTMSFEQTHPFHAALVDAYTRTGYSLVVVPTGSVEDRVAVVRGFIEARST
jgi:predicted ATPase